MLQVIGPLLAPRGRIVALDADRGERAPDHVTHRRILLGTERGFDTNPTVGLEVVHLNPINRARNVTTEFAVADGSALSSRPAPRHRCRSHSLAIVQTVRAGQLSQSGRP
jgi:hypothetical protein